jgi:hypothetical protein
MILAWKWFLPHRLWTKTGPLQTMKVLWAGLFRGTMLAFPVSYPPVMCLLQFAGTPVKVRIRYLSRLPTIAQPRHSWIKMTRGLKYVCDYPDKLSAPWRLHPKYPRLHPRPWFLYHEYS